jgi:hypothetical protein
MKKVLMFLLVPFIFQQCTDELSEIQEVVGDDSAYSSTALEAAEIPYNAYKATYFNSHSNTIPITERNENFIEQKILISENSDTFNEATSAFWVGDFDFDGGDYEISVQADKNVTMLIDDQYVLDEIGNDNRRISYNTFKALDGVHRVLVFYNMDKSQIAKMILAYYSGMNAKDRILESANSSKPSRISPDFKTANRNKEQILPHVIVQWRLQSKKDKK